ncbi:MAG: exosortase A [Candidatus Competibacteraceae bacterium]
MHAISESLPHPIEKLNRIATGYWRWTLALLGLVLIALLGWYWQTALSMAQTWWHSETYAHGMLIIPIALYMIWRRRHTLAGLLPRSTPAGLPIVFSAVIAWLVAYAAGVSVVQQFALITLVVASIVTLLGWQVSWALAFPLGYLYFAVPVGAFLTLPLQDFTAWFSVILLRATGIPVFWEGHRLVLPTGEFEVAEACSGLRYLIASLALGCLYAYLSYHTLWRRLAFIALALVVPIIANGLRAYGILMLAYLSSGKIATGVDHLIYGWLFFGFVVLLMFWIGSFWREANPPDIQSGATAMPAITHPDASFSAGRLVFTALTCVLMLSLGPAGAARLNAGISQHGPILLTAPTAVAPWSGPLEGDPDWQPVFRGADGTLLRSYRWHEQPVYLYLAYYRRQRQDAKLVSSLNTLFDGKHWVYAGEQRLTIPLASGTQSLVATRVNSVDRKRLIWHWYWIGGRTTTSPYLTKLLEAWDVLSGSRRGSAIVAIAADYQLQPAEAEVLLRQFLESMAGGIKAVLAGQNQG